MSIIKQKLGFKVLCALSFALLLAWWNLRPGVLLPACDFRLELDGSRARYTFCNSTVEVPAVLNSISGFKVTDAPSVTPADATVIRVSSANNSDFAVVPNYEEFYDNTPHPPTSDWFLDGTIQGKSIASHIEPIKVPLTMQGTFYGRGNNFLRLELDSGGKHWMFEVRRGLMSYGLSVNLDGKVIGEAQLEPEISTLLVWIAKPLAASILLGLLAVWGVGGSIKHGSFCGASMLAVCISLIFTAGCGYVAYEILAGLPHFQDDLGYLLRAKWLLQGSPGIPIDPVNVLLDLPFTFEREGQIFSVYPIGWPLILAAGCLFNVPWLMAPLCGGLTAYLIFQLGCRLCSARVGLFAQILFVSSPLAVILSSSLMSHAAACLAATLFLYCLCRAYQERSLKFWIFCGISIGFCCTIRPLTGLAIALSALPLLAYAVLRNFSWRHSLAAVLAGCIGIAGGILPQIIDNFFVTGEPLKFAYTVGLGHTFSLNNLRETVQLTDSTWSLVSSSAFGAVWWRAGSWLIALVSLSFAWWGLAIRGFRLLSLCGILVWVSLPLAYLGHAHSGLHGFGPRFYYETFPVLFLLSALGLSALTESINRLGGAIFAGLVAITLLASNAAGTISRAPYYKGYNLVNEDLRNVLKDLDPTGKVIVLTRWEDLASASNFLFTPSSKFIFVQEGGTRLEDARKSFPKYEFWRWQGDKKTVEKIS